LKCYVYSRPVQTIDTELNLTIRDFVPVFAATVKQLRLNQDDEAGAIGSDIRDVAHAPKRKGSVVLLIGGIGSGKTTFLKRFFRVVAPELTVADGPAFRLHLEFLGAPDRVEELDAFLWSAASDALRTQEPGLIERRMLERVFASKLTLINKIFATEKAQLDAKVNEELFRLSVDPQAFTLAVLKYCSAYGKLPIVLFDNVDQLAVPIQTHIFTTAEHFANHLGCLSVLVIREESYSTAQMQKQLTAYTIRAYHLSSPSFRQMIRLRIDFATHHAACTNEQPELTVSNVPLQYRSEEILEFFDLLRRSVFGRNHNIMRLIEAISFGNMRFALLLFNNFITSGATNMPKILEKFKNGGYTVPFHEFAKSVILGDYRFYRESRSLIANLFRSTAARNASHLTSLRILSYLATSSRKHGSGDGFIDLQELITAFVDVFDNEDDCIKTVGRLIALNRQLAELDTRRTDTLVGAYAIGITTAGKYYLNYMVNAFSYLDLVWHDTPIGDRAVAEKLTRLIHSTDMDERFARVDLFLTYLETEEEKELTVAGIHGAGSGICGPFLPRVKQLFAKEKLDVRKRLRKADRAHGRSLSRQIRNAFPADT
jgi:energy-coupling factor transporter ATP-binding protein EcfA2